MGTIIVRGSSNREISRVRYGFCNISELLDCSLRSTPSMLSSQMIAFSLIHFNEFKARYEQFIDIQKQNYLNARNWANLGTTFLCKVISRSHSEKQDSLSQINSRSIFNSDRSCVIKPKSSEDEQDDPSKLKFLSSKSKKSKKADVILAEITKSSEYVDFTIEKDNQDQTKLAISCLKRYTYI